MISYAQNNEDVLLNRVFEDVPRGRYVDVGAGHPTWESVTRHFYDLGWRGINIEPRPDMYELLVAERPEDINLRAGIADQPGEEMLYQVEVPGYHAAAGGGLSTFAAEIAQQHRALDRTLCKVPTPLVTLDQILESHDVGEIDFLKIDVEGFERQVVLSLDWHRWRPRVALLEAIDVATQQPNYEDWEGLILGADYLFACFDGINRYYVRSEDSHLLERFRAPVNVLDEYLPVRFVQIQRDHEQLRIEHENMLYNTGPKSLKIGLKIARHVHRLLRI